MKHRSYLLLAVYATLLGGSIGVCSPVARADSAGRPDVPAADKPGPATDKNSKLIEKYVFASGTADTVMGAPGYDTPASLVGCTWSKPGFEGAVATATFDDKSSIARLPGGKTPVGPVAIRGVIRPRVLNGVWFSDVGGLILAVKPDGTVSAQRHTSDAPWTYIASTTAIPVGQWSTIEYQWDGTMQRLYINGTFAVEGASGAGFGSGPRGLGCNCWGPTSDHFAGDIASFEVRTLNAK